MFDWLIHFVNTYLVSFVLDAVLAALVLPIGFKLVKFLTSRIEKYKLFRKLDSNIGALILHSLRLLLNALVVIITIQILGVPSPQFAKIEVNGANEAPLYTFLKQQKGGFSGNQIKWNFTKFLVDRDGVVRGRFASAATSEKIEKHIKELL